VHNCFKEIHFNFYVRNYLIPIIFAALISTVSFSTMDAYADHVPLNIDVPILWAPPQDSIDGYLEFINPTEHPNLIGVLVPATPPGAIFTEEHTGYTDIFGLDFIEVGDSDITYGDKADFDWVQQNRDNEVNGISHHPGLIGAMGWTPGSPEMSPHNDPAFGVLHGHSVTSS